MVKAHKSKKYLNLSNMRASYNAKTQTVEITTTDPDILGKSKTGFLLRVGEGTPEENILIKLLQEQEIIKYESFYKNTLDSSNIISLHPYLFPIGVDEKGESTIWDVTEKSHFFVTGRPGTGKSTLIDNMMSHAKSHPNNYTFSFYDPKNISSHMTDNQNKLDAFERIIDEAYAIFEVNTSNKENGISSKDHIVFLDGATDLYWDLEAFKPNRLQPKNSKVSFQIRSINRKIRKILLSAVGVHIVLSSQEIPHGIEEILLYEKAKNNIQFFSFAQSFQNLSKVFGQSFINYPFEKNGQGFYLVNDGKYKKVSIYPPQNMS